MGEEITQRASSLADVEEGLSLLRNLCAWHTTDLDTTENRLRELKRKLIAPPFPSLFQHLGVSVGGFVYLNRSKQEPEYGFFSAATATQDDSIASYMIPYQPYSWTSASNGPLDTPQLPNKDCEIVIDSLFYIHRKNQNPFPSSRLNTPEYLQDLPIAGYPYRGVTGEETALDDGIRVAYGVHYVPYGELVAFTLMWRRILSLLTSSASNPWLSPVWHGREEGPVLYECELASAVKGDQPPDYLPGHKTLAQFLNNHYATHSREWETDLCHMQLLGTSNVVAQTQRPLGRFVANLDLSFPDDISADSLCRLADALLARVCNLTVPAQARPDDLFTTLRQLHDKSRFPILPYYYWTAISHRPRTHAVIPIVASVVAPIETPVNHPIVGMAVVGMRPLSILDGTWTDDNETREEASRRCVAMMELVRLISAPQVDVIYYDELQVHEAAAAQYVKAIAGFEHDSSKRLNPIEMIVDHLLRGELANASDTTKAALEHVKTQAKQIRIRMGAYSVLAADSPNIPDTMMTQLTNGIDRSELTGFVPTTVADILSEEFAAAVVRSAIMGHKCCRTICGFSDSMPSIVEDLTGAESQCRKWVDASAGLSFIVPAKIRMPYKSTRLYAALRMLFCEVIENYCKHELMHLNDENGKQSSRVNVTPPLLQLAIDVERAVAGGFRCSLRLTFVPFAEPTYTLSGNFTGLASIKHAAKCAGIDIPQADFRLGSRTVRLPFFEVIGQRHVWTFTGVLLRRTS